MQFGEAPVERIFSHLKYLFFGEKNYQMPDELLNSELGIKMDNTCGTQNE